MIALALSLMLTTQAAPPAAPAPPAGAGATPPADWSALPALRLRRPPELSAAVGSFAREEVAAGRCPAPRRGPIHVELAVLVGPAGVLRIVPRAIGCATVEQYASGLVSRFARGNVEPDGDGGAETGWHVTTVDFAWSQ